MCDVLNWLVLLRGFHTNRDVRDVGTRGLLVRDLQIDNRVVSIEASENNRAILVQGGEDPKDALSCRCLFAKEPLIIGLFCEKCSIKIRHPTTLRHPVQIALLLITQPTQPNNQTQSIYMHGVTRPYACCIWDMTDSCVGDVTYSYAWHDLFIYVTWLIHVCDMTYSYV